MSYEGYVQALCEKGHYLKFDASQELYISDEESPVRCLCGAKVAWRNHVDDTNCDAVGVIPPAQLKTLMVKEEVRKECPTCHHVEVAEPAVYRIPTEEELKKLQHSFDNGVYAPLESPRS